MSNTTLSLRSQSGKEDQIRLTQAKRRKRHKVSEPLKFAEEHSEEVLFKVDKIKTEPGITVDYEVNNTIPPTNSSLSKTNGALHTEPKNTPSAASRHTSSKRCCVRRKQTFSERFPSQTLNHVSKATSSSVSTKSSNTTDVAYVYDATTQDTTNQHTAECQPNCTITTKDLQGCHNVVRIRSECEDSDSDSHDKTRNHTESNSSSQYPDLTDDIIKKEVLVCPECAFMTSDEQLFDLHALQHSQSDHEATQAINIESTASRADSEVIKDVASIELDEIIRPSLDATETDDVVKAASDVTDTTDDVTDTIDDATDNIDVVTDTIDDVVLISEGKRCCDDGTLNASSSDSDDLFDLQSYAQTKIRERKGDKKAYVQTKKSMMMQKTWSRRMVYQRYAFNFDENLLFSSGGFPFNQVWHANSMYGWPKSSLSTLRKLNNHKKEAIVKFSMSKNSHTSSCMFILHLYV